MVVTCSGFTGATAVTFGTVGAAGFTVNSSTQSTVTAPGPHPRHGEHHRDHTQRVGPARRNGRVHLRFKAEGHGCLAIFWPRHRWHHGHHHRDQGYRDHRRDVAGQSRPGASR